MEWLHFITDWRFVLGSILFTFALRSLGDSVRLYLRSKKVLALFPASAVFFGGLAYWALRGVITPANANTPRMMLCGTALYTVAYIVYLNRDLLKQKRNFSPSNSGK